MWKYLRFDDFIGRKNQELAQSAKAAPNSNWICWSSETLRSTMEIEFVSFLGEMALPSNKFVYVYWTYCYRPPVWPFLLVRSRLKFIPFAPNCVRSSSSTQLCGFKRNTCLKCIRTDSCPSSSWFSCFLPICRIVVFVSWLHSDVSLRKYGRNAHCTSVEWYIRTTFLSPRPCLFCKLPCLPLKPRLNALMFGLRVWCIVKSWWWFVNIWAFELNFSCSFSRCLKCDFSSSRHVLKTAILFIYLNKLRPQATGTSQSSDGFIVRGKCNWFNVRYFIANINLWLEFSANII